MRLQGEGSTAAGYDTDRGRGRVTLPESMRRYFWDYGRRELTLDGNRYTVLKRLLESGGWGAVKWLRANVDEGELRAFIIQRRGRGMSPKRLRFWGLIVGLPRSQVDRWTRAQEPNPWTRRTRS